MCFFCCVLGFSLLEGEASDFNFHLVFLLLFFCGFDKLFNSHKELKVLFVFLQTEIYETEYFKFMFFFNSFLKQVVAGEQK